MDFDFVNIKTISNRMKVSSATTDRYEAQLLVLDIIPVILAFLTRLLGVTNQIRTHKYIGVLGLELKEADPCTFSHQ